MEFKAFPKIERMGKLNMVITQKIHGTNAQVFIRETTVNEPADYYDPETEKNYIVRAGSRTRWIFVGDDNYGFAAFVNAHKEEFVKKLGVGQHFGEWAGPGINSGEGLTEKTFVLFDFWRYPSERPLPPQTKVVPVLYQGPADLEAVNKTMEELKINGSVLVKGFMRPEGVVVTLAGTRYKKVFDAEETQWTKPSGEKAPKVHTEFTLGHLLQPIRLEKLISRDERYIREYPMTLVTLVKDYVDDLVVEGQIVGDEAQIKAIRKQLGGELFKFVKTEVEKRI